MTNPPGISFLKDLKAFLKNTFKKLLASILKVDWGVMANPILQVGISSIRLEEKTSFGFVNWEETFTVNTGSENVKTDLSLKWSTPEFPQMFHRQPRGMAWKEEISLILVSREVWGKVSSTEWNCLPLTYRWTSWCPAYKWACSVSQTYSSTDSFFNGLFFATNCSENSH